jgi:hypothetical protein
MRLTQVNEIGVTMAHAKIHCNASMKNFCSLPVGCHQVTMTKFVSKLPQRAFSGDLEDS